MITKDDIVVNVTSVHIARGSKTRCTDCPIAYAIIEALAEGDNNKARDIYGFVSVAQDIRLPSEISYAHLGIPRDMSHWITMFDSGLTLPEFSFTIHRLTKYPNVPTAEIINVKFKTPNDVSLP